MAMSMIEMQRYAQMLSDAELQQTDRIMDAVKIGEMKRRTEVRNADAEAQKEFDANQPPQPLPSIAENVEEEFMASMSPQEGIPSVDSMEAQPSITLIHS